MASSNFIIAISTQLWSRAATVEQLRSTLIRFDVTSRIVVAVGRDRIKIFQGKFSSDILSTA